MNETEQPSERRRNPATHIVDVRADDAYNSHHQTFAKPLSADSIVNVGELLDRLKTKPPTIPGYTIERELGQGGMGTVFLARDNQLARSVAVKVIRAERFDADTASRFTSEARMIASLNHPGIVQVFACGASDANLYLVMEYVPGGPLAAVLSARSLPPTASAEVIRQLAQATQAAHTAGIVHRDIKPANVLLTRPARRAGDPIPQVKLADFGLARHLASDIKHTQTGEVIGTPSYMSPEQALGQQSRIGPATDVYALGAVLYECLTGRPPFQGSHPFDTLMHVVNTEAVPVRRLNPSVPRDLETICLKCLQKDPARRYTSAETLADDLQRFLDGRPIQARPVSATERVWRWGRRRPTLAGLIAACVLAVLAFLTASVVYTLNVREAWKHSEQLVAAERQQRNQARQARDALLARIVDRVEPGTPLDVEQRSFLEGILTAQEEALADTSTGRDVRRERAAGWRRLAVLRQVLGKPNAADAVAESEGLLVELVAEQPDDEELRRELEATRKTGGQP